MPSCPPRSRHLSMRSRSKLCVPRPSARARQLHAHANAGPGGDPARAAQGKCNRCHCNGRGQCKGKGACRARNAGEPHQPFLRQAPSKGCVGDAGEAGACPDASHERAIGERPSSDLIADNQRKQREYGDARQAKQGPARDRRPDFR